MSLSRGAFAAACVVLAASTTALVSASLSVGEGAPVRGVRTDVAFGPLDPNNTDPSTFWMPLWNTVPQDYCEHPRYPIEGSFGPIVTSILDDVYPNGTVPNVVAKPTNTWQKNLWGFAWDNFGEWGAVYPYPYIVSPKTKVINIMYPGAPVNLTDNRAMGQGFQPAPSPTIDGPPIHNASYPYMQMSAAFDFSVQILNGVYPKLTEITDVSATVIYRDPSQGNKTVATVYLVKGSPFINIECDGALLAFGSNIPPPIIGLNNAVPGTPVTSSDFTLTVAVGPAHPQGETWHAYFSSPVTIDFPNPPNRPMNISGAFTGLLQVGCGTNNDAMGEFLTKNAGGAYAKGATMAYDIDDANETATVKFNWIIGNAAGTGGANTSALAMLALAHHVRLLNTSEGSGATAMPSHYWCVKGNMTTVLANEWRLTYNLTTVGFGDELRVSRAMAPRLLQSALTDYNLRIGKCPGDNATQGYPGYMNMELYAYVRDLAQMTDVAIVLENLGRRQHAINMTQQVLKCMAPVLKRPSKAPYPCPPPINGSNPPQCVRDMMDVYFDTQYGGLITGHFDRFATGYCQCDKPGGPYACRGYNYCDNPRGWDAFANYGNAFYNDHHFQYGYIVKSLAWAIYFQTTKGAALGMNATTVANVSKQALAFARDISNPAPQADTAFTYNRHKDTYDGHSWAEGYDYSGRSLTWVNQQSGGEAVNGYYGVYLLGVALNDTNVRDWGRIQLATEAFSVAQYQHLSNQTEDKIDQPTQKINQWGKCLSILFGNGASGATYYGPNAIFQCGITVLPISPFTREWVDPAWALEAVSWMKWQVNSTGICVFYDPLTMPENPCPGPNPKNWSGNSWACCPTNVGYPSNQWRSYPEWFPYMYVLEGIARPHKAFAALHYTNITQPTKALPFPYVAADGRVVGYQADLTRTAALFHIATFRR